MSDEPSVFEPTRRQWTGFWSMIVQQTQNAFNDKMAQFILIPLGGAVGFSVESAAGLMIAVPFVLFAPVAGWMSDRFSKRNVMLGAAIFSGSALDGALLMGAFGLGTAPAVAGMLLVAGIGAGVRWRRISGALLVAFGLWVAAVPLVGHG